MSTTQNFISIFVSFLILLGRIADANAIAKTADVTKELDRDSGRISQGWATLSKLIEAAATSGKFEREDLLLEVEKIVSGGSLDAVAEAIVGSGRLVSMEGVMDLAANLSSVISSAMNFTADGAGRAEEDVVVDITSPTEEDFDASAENWTRSSGSGKDVGEVSEDGFTSGSEFEHEDLGSGAEEPQEALPGWLPDEKGFADDLDLKVQNLVLEQQASTSSNFDHSESPSSECSNTSLLKTGSSKIVVIVATQVCLCTLVLAYMVTSKLIKRSRHGSSVVPTEIEMLGGNPRLHFPPTHSSHLVAKQQTSGRC